MSKRLLLNSTKKPSRREFIVTFRITFIGLVVIGLIGYIIHTAVTALVEAFS